MEYKFEDLDKIMGFSTWSTKQKIDELLRINADLRCNLGTDSTKAEIKEADRKWKKMAKAINSIDPVQGSLFLRAILLEEHENK
jgi:hypothetical protein